MIMFLSLHRNYHVHVLIIILQSAFHIRVFQLRSRGSEDHFSLEIAQVVDRELKRVV